MSARLSAQNLTHHYRSSGFLRPRLAAPAANGKARKGTTYMRKYGKTLKALAAEVGLHPSVVATRVRRGWSMKEALKTPARPRAPNGVKSAKRTKRALDKPTAAA